MCSKTKTRYSIEDDKYILRCARTSETVCHGLTKAARALGRTEKAVLYRYYNVLKNSSLAKKQVKKAVVTKAPKKTTMSNFISKHQKMLDMDVRFSLASLAKDHENITITIQGKQITAVFK
jgi:PHP family Zn ribbon phosphoesterase